MSETIDYYGFISNLKKSEFSETIALVETFQNAETIDQHFKGCYKGRCGTIEFEVDGGWRGGGRSCEEIIKEHFEEFCKKHPEIEVKVYATYVQHSPQDVITMKGNDVDCNADGGW